MEFEYQLYIVVTMRTSHFCVRKHARNCEIAYLVYRRFGARNSIVIKKQLHIYTYPLATNLYERHGNVYFVVC